MRITIAFIGVFLCTMQWSVSQTVRRDSLFDFDWRFHRGKISEAQQISFDDKNWRTLNLPHDWSIEDLPDSYREEMQNIANDSEKTHLISGPFDSRALCGKHSGFTVGGTGWYRKHFSMPISDTGKIVTINFDGVYMNSDVWINGHHLGNRPYGYTAFTYELSKYLNYGTKENVLAVEVKNEGINSRWYSGSGIYRHVHLSVVDKIHIAPEGIFITTPEVTSSQSKVVVQIEVENSTREDADVDVSVYLADKNGNTFISKNASARLAHCITSIVKLEFEIQNPMLWSPETPNLYRAICTIQNNNGTIDKTEKIFGIRSLFFDSEHGLLLNGKSIKLKGGSMHANNGPLGAAAYDRAEERRVELLKKASFNAIRCGHNPPSTAFLDACDRIGMLVIDEAFDVWAIGWLPDDYHIYFKEWWRQDITSMIRRDRNHPSVFTYSICNQVRDNYDSSVIGLGFQIAGFVRALDPTRPVSANVAQYRGGWHNCKHEDWRNCDAFISALDIVGYSYQSSQYEYDHQRLPARIMFSSEIDPLSSFSNWMSAIDHDFVLGNFEWSAMDFMGEVSLGWAARESFTAPDSALFPWMSTNSGDFDLCGFRKPRSYYRDILFRNENKLSVFVASPVPSYKYKNDSPWGWADVKPSWTWPGYENKIFPIEVYSACDSVELLMNGKSFGVKPTSRATEFKAVWTVPYQRGTLTAVGYTHGIRIATSELRSAGEPAAILLTADRRTIKADGQDLCYVTFEVVDKDGILVPYADNEIHFDVNGEGSLAAVGNSNPLSVESFCKPFRKAHEGKGLAIVKGGFKDGKIVIRAGSNGLKSHEIEIQTIHF